MTEDKGSAAPGANSRDRFKLELVGFDGGERPALAIAAIDAKRNSFHVAGIDTDGGFALPADVLKRAARILVGTPDEKQGVVRRSALDFEARDFVAQVGNGTLALAEPVWSRFRFFWVCTSGSVRVCRRRRWWFDSLVAVSTDVLRQAPVARFAPSNAAQFAQSSVAEISRPSIGELLAWPVRCFPVCLGNVEVWRRTCCCYPIVIDDWRIADLIRDLERFVPRLPRRPRPKFPPPPPPPLGDPLQTLFFKGGGLNELALNAAADLQALRGLATTEAAQYIEARAYLYHRLCTCSRPQRMGSGAILSDGSFNVCWREGLRLFRPNCHDQYAYVVRQTIGGTTTVIYDGLAAGAWFAAGEEPVLTSYDPNAFTCDETGDDEGDALVFLDLIGDTESHELTTPASTGWDRVAAPAATSGLLFPGIGPNNSHLRNLGGGIELTYFFSLGMRDPAIGAHFYRLSVSEADAGGAPIGPRYYWADGLAWQKVVGADIVPETLGPLSAGGENNLYRIPYADEAWVGSVRHHVALNTLVPELNAPLPGDLASPAKNRLVTLEVFDAAGQRLRPLGTPASGQPGAEAAKPFKFRRWFQPGGSPGDDTVEVPFAALTHLFCWDNRPPVADITRLVMDGTASDEECQFLEGPGTSQFAIEYRAYVADERFQFGHGIGWLRGLNASAANGGIGSLPTPLSPANVGEPPALPVASGANSFELMLTRLDAPNPPVVLPRCSFAVTLTTYAKTTNGGDLNYPHAQETAAFALAIADGFG